MAIFIMKKDSHNELCSVIVWGNDNSNTLGLIRQLHGLDVDVLFLINKKPHYCAVKSKYCHKYVILQDLQAGYQYLIDHASDFINKPVLIPTSDVVAEIIDQNKTTLSSYYILMGTDEPGLLTKVLDKNYMSELAIASGFKVPNSVAWSTYDKVPDVNFPCIVKPNKNSNSRPKTFKTRRCNDKATLIDLLHSVPKGCEFIIQDYIPKESDMLIYGCRLLDGTVIMPGALIKERWSIYGDGSYGWILKDHPECFNKAPIISFLEKIAYYGLFSFEFGLYEGEYYFYEVNLRNDGTSHYFFQAGLNLPAAWVLSSYGRSYVDEVGEIKQNQRFIDEVFDRFNIRYGIVTKKSWKLQRSESTVFVYYQKNDQLPYYYMLIKAFIKSILLRFNAI